ncbi:MAG: response regulator transcription factor [Clostridia bacterium]|nr:response regulator transcription factor [Clostridia bacterium]
MPARGARRLPRERGGRRPLRVVVVEDEGLFRDLLRSALGRLPQVEVVGAFADGAAALEAAPDLAPDVAVLDVRLGRGPNGLQVARQLRRHLPGLGIVILSGYADSALFSAIPEDEVAGWSYLVKSSVGDVSALVRAIEGAAAGLVVLDPALVSRSRPRARSRVMSLRPREREVLELIAQGYSNEGIAEALSLSTKTVANVINLVYASLGVERAGGRLHPRVQAVLAYLESYRPERPDDARA